jgi:hypothetical protein
MPPTEAEIEKLLQKLQSKKAYRRREAAELLGGLAVRHERVISTLETVATADPNRYVRAAARSALFTLSRAQSAPETPPPAPPPLTGLRNPQNRYAFMIGFGGWLVINGLIWFFILRPNTYTPEVGAIDIGKISLLFLANLVPLILLTLIRRWMALGMGVAFVVSLLAMGVLWIIFRT